VGSLATCDTVPHEEGEVSLLLLVDGIVYVNYRRARNDIVNNGVRGTRCPSGTTIANVAATLDFLRWRGSPGAKAALMDDAVEVCFIAGDVVPLSLEADQGEIGADQEEY
jgi:hypothetical protein